MQPALEAVLHRLHDRMRREEDLWQRLSAEQRDAHLDEMMLPIGEEAGRFLNLLAKAARSRTILELGTSVGYSTLWLADAAQETGGRVTTVDANPDKTAQARGYVADAGLADSVDFITGDAVAACRDVPGPVELVLLDTWKDVYLPCFEALHDNLAPGALVAADNMIHGESPNTRAYQAHVRAAPGFASVLVPIGNGIEVTRRMEPDGAPWPDAALDGVLERLHERMAEEARLRTELSAEAFAARRPELMLAIGEETARLLHTLALAAGATRILEIGTSVGYSTLWLADAARRTGGRVTTLDGSADKHRQAREHLAAAALPEHVELVTDLAPAALAGLAGPFDLVLLDCERHDYLPCFQAFAGKLAPGALVVADNMTFPPSPHAPAYQRHVRGLPGFESMGVPIGNGVELTRRTL